MPAPSSRPARPRCLVIVPVAETVRHIVGPELRALSAEVEFRIICSGGEDVAALRAEGWDVVTVPIGRKLSPLGDLVSIWRLVREVRRFRPSILHSYMPKGGLLGQLAGAFTGVPLRLHSCRGLLYQPGMPGWGRALFRLTDRITFALATRVLFVSRADRELMVTEGLVRESKAVWTGNGVDLGRFRRSGRSAEQRRLMRESLGYLPEHRVLLTIGRFVVDKGYGEAAEAAAILRPRFPEVRWLWVAPLVTGETDVIDPALPEHLKVQDLVTVLGRQSDPLPYYLAADLFVHPSYREGAPRVVMEASACGLPVVATDIPGCREVVYPGENGILVAPRSAEALANGIASLLDDAVRLAAMAESASRMAVTSFDVQSVVARVRREYQLLAAPQ